jgi:hypothetical protein
MHGRIFFGVALLALACGASAQHLRFLKGTPAAHFKGDDQQLMQRNVQAALESAAADARHEWSNPKTGSSGWAQVKGEFTATDGAPCKRLRVVNRAGGVENDSTQVVCKYEGRGWLIHPDAEPADTQPAKQPDQEICK